MPIIGRYFRIDEAALKPPTEPHGQLTNENEWHSLNNQLARELLQVLDRAIGSEEQRLRATSAFSIPAFSTARRMTRALVGCCVLSSMAYIGPSGDPASPHKMWLLPHRSKDKFYTELNTPAHNTSLLSRHIPLLHLSFRQDGIDVPTFIIYYAPSAHPARLKVEIEHFSRYGARPHKFIDHFAYTIARNAIPLLPLMRQFCNLAAREKDERCR